jgi:hypothetical protein
MEQQTEVREKPKSLKDVADHERTRQALATAKQANETRAAKRDELNALFDNLPVHVADDHQNQAGPWRVSMWLSEDDVRRLAPLLKSFVVKGTE